MTSGERVVVLHSGGLDSSTLLYELHAQGMRVVSLGIHYGQRHAKELTAARAIAWSLRIPHGVVSLPPIVTQPKPVPDGHYAEESMKATISPNRNMILLAYAVGYAIYHAASAVAYAAHSGDHTIYPDCRPEFVSAIQQAVTVGNWESVKILAPYIRMSKADIVNRGIALGVPFAETWSCYKGLDRHCGTCGTCVERHEAFTLCSVKDPTEYGVVIHSSSG